MWQYRGASEALDTYRLSHDTASRGRQDPGALGSPVPRPDPVLPTVGPGPSTLRSNPNGADVESGVESPPRAPTDALKTTGDDGIF